MVMHFVLAITNACNALKYVTRFSCDVFGFYVAFIYLQKGIQVLTRQFTAGDTSAYLAIMVSLLVLITAYACGVIGSSSLFQHYVRVFIKDYGTPLTICFFTGFVHIDKMKKVNLPVLPTVSSLIAQGTEFPLRKPAGFHWDIFLLGVTTGVAGLLGVPFPNGLIPQAPFHTTSLCVTRLKTDANEEHKGKTETIVDYVVEQRVSNLAQGLLILGTMSGPILAVLHLIPEAVLSGLFFVMGIQALEANGITRKILFLANDRSHTPANDPLKRVKRRTAVWVFLGIELLAFGATFAITQTIAAVGFPVFILLLIPVRTYLLPKYFTGEELSILDAPTASPFTMESVGGNYGAPSSTDVLPGATEPPSDEEKTVDLPKKAVGSRAKGNNDESFMERGESPMRKRRSSVMRDERGIVFGPGDTEGDTIEMHRIS
ncbi:MAG: hypothetical protein M1813_004248 [Trichoglossum hirsutum]|nr:MAG: hypothetical protein M1813_004248 [Trichoglossum hirsutum]